MQKGNAEVQRRRNKIKSITADAAEICMCVPQSRVVNIHVQVVVIDVHCQLKALKIRVSK